MKKKITILILLFLAVACFASTIIVPFDTENTRVDPGQVHTKRNRWVVIDTTSSTGTEPSNLAVNKRTYQAVLTAIAAAASGDDEISVLGIPRSWNGIRLRCIGITDGSSVIYQIYLGTLGVNSSNIATTTADCELSYAGQLAFTIGTQVSTTTSYELADTLTVTSSDWVKSWSSTSPTGNRVAEAEIDVSGADVIIALATTAGSDCKLLGKGY